MTRPPFTGTLRSGFDEPDELPAEFAQLQATHSAALAAYVAGRVSRDKLVEVLGQLMLIHEGARWTIGASSGRWFCDSGAGWEAKTPPAKLTPQPQAVPGGVPAAHGQDLDSLLDEVLEDSTPAPASQQPAPAPAPAQTAMPVVTLDDLDMLDDIDDIDDILG